MKKIALICCFLVGIIACKTENKKVNTLQTASEDMAYQSFGKAINADDALEASRMATHYKSMQLGDTVNSKMIATVEEVCQAKGCWMKLSLDNGEQVMVKFKDYGFFMPKDIKGKEVIVNGIAFVNEMSVDEQQHYAEDEGQSDEEIAAITKPKKTYSFEADGVLLKQ